MDSARFASRRHSRRSSSHLRLHRPPCPRHRLCQRRCPSSPRPPPPPRPRQRSSLPRHLQPPRPLFPVCRMSPHIQKNLRRRRARRAEAGRARRPTWTPTVLTKILAKTKRRRTDALYAVKRLDLQVSSVAAGACSARCTGTVTSTTAPSTTGNWVRKRSAATTPSSSHRRYTRYEPHLFIIYTYLTYLILSKPRAECFLRTHRGAPAANLLRLVDL